MNLTLQIEHLLLEDIDLSYSDRLRLQEATAAELSQLIRTKGFPTQLQNGGTISQIPISLCTSVNQDPVKMGQQIAYSIYQKISCNSSYSG